MENIFSGMVHYRKNGFLGGAPRFFVLLLLLGYCALVFSAPATAAENPKVDKVQANPAQTSAPPAAPQPTQSSAPTVNPITQAAAQAGVLSCASRINWVLPARPRC